MFFKVITVTLITICAADNRLVHTEVNSEQQLPVLRFNGHAFLPTIQNYDKVDKHSTLKSIIRPVRSALPNIFQKLQYAPLQESGSLSNKNANPDYVRKVTPTPSSAYLDPTETQYSKSYLEPRSDVTNTKCYASRYKASVSRSPGHNAVYRVIPEPVEIEKPIKISDYDKPIGINLKLDPLPTTKQPLLDFTSVHVHSKPLPNDRFIINPEMLDAVEPVPDKSKRYSPHAKYHRLHLNIARVYSPGQVPPKPEVFPSANIYPGLKGWRHPHSQAFVPEAYPELNLNTRLYPVKRHRKGYRFHTSIIHL